MQNLNNEFRRLIRKCQRTRRFSLVALAKMIGMDKRALAWKMYGLGELNLREIADIFTALDYRVRVTVEDIEKEDGK